jgi:hypothetical protein
MSKSEKPTDECVTNAAIQGIHNAVSRGGTKAPLNDLLGRETALGAYVMYAGHTVAETVRISGAPPSLVNWVKESVMAHALVCIEAQQQAHFQLWRDFMGDSDERAEDKPTGDDHGK